MFRTAIFAELLPLATTDETIKNTYCLVENAGMQLQSAPFS